LLEGLGALADPEKRDAVVAVSARARGAFRRSVFPEIEFASIIRIALCGGNSAKHDQEREQRKSSSPQPAISETRQRGRDDRERQIHSILGDRLHRDDARSRR